MHATPLSEKALIPTVGKNKKQNKRKKKKKKKKPTALHLKMHCIGLVFNWTEFQESK